MIMEIKALRLLMIIFMAAVSQVACKQGVRNEASKGNDDTGVARDTPSRKAYLQYAKGFSIDYYDHYKLVRILNRESSVTDTLFYLLVENGYPVPAGFPGAQVIRIPVQSIVGMSSMHVALADFAGVADRITGLGSLEYISSPEVRQRIKAGQVKEVGLDGSMNNELILTMRPGVLIAMGNPDAGFGKYKILTDAGVPVLLNAEWLESTPLGRAEWVKLMGALVDSEDRVDKKFDSLAGAYNRLAQLARNTRDKPHVIIGMPFKGSWFTPAGESYMGQFLRDAGAGYKWSDSKGTGSLALDFESVAPEALSADYWLDVGDVGTKKDIVTKDARYSSFRSFRTGRVYNNNKRTNELGSNDYWESGAVNPQVVLADMIRILHPDLLPDHQLVYYKQLN
jgi:iron complex transport system substrate-binding protein